MTQVDCLHRATIAASNEFQNSRSKEMEKISEKLSERLAKHGDIGHPAAAAVPVAKPAVGAPRKVTFDVKDEEDETIISDQTFHWIQNAVFDVQKLAEDILARDSETPKWSWKATKTKPIGRETVSKLGSVVVRCLMADICEGGSWYLQPRAAVQYSSGIELGP